MTPPINRQRAARWAAIASSIAFAWMIVAWLGGGFDTWVFGIRVRSNDPDKARLWGEIALAIYICLRGPAEVQHKLATIVRAIRRHTDSAAQLTQHHHGVRSLVRQEFGELVLIRRHWSRRGFRRRRWGLERWGWRVFRRLRER